MGILNSIDNGMRWGMTDAHPGIMQDVDCDFVDEGLTQL